MKMKKNIYLIIGLLITGLISCTSDFDEINVNPNQPITAPATNVLGYSIQSIAQRFGSTEIFYPGAFVGYTAKGTYNLVNRYAEVAPSSHWTNLFSYAIQNLNYVIESSPNANQRNIKAAAMVMKAYAFQLLVDTYGPIPYTEYGKMREGIVYPKYDNEKVVYTDLLTSLKEANSMFNATTGGKIGVGDLIYSGDVAKWKKFCNSLRLRLAIRISKVEPALAASNISEILNDATTYPVFSSNTDNATLKFPGADWMEPWASAYKGVPDVKIGKPIVDKLLSLNDPRLPFYAKANNSGNYVGLEIGADATSTISLVSDRFMQTETGTVFFQKYAEVEFIRAEAAKLGIITSSAQTAYENGVKASLAEYSVPEATITAYLGTSGVSWTNDINQIYEQKWIALFRQCWEAWAEQRRTDYPALGLAVNSSVSGHNRTPFRFSYPIEERNLNGDNVPASVTEKDMFWGYQIWWDKRTNVQ
jgi:hypothetical protein